MGHGGIQNWASLLLESGSEEYHVWGHTRNMVYGHKMNSFVECLMLQRTFISVCFFLGGGGEGFMFHSERNHVVHFLLRVDILKLRYVS
jgi:Na+/pantothenate symporter